MKSSEQIIYEALSSLIHLLDKKPPPWVEGLVYSYYQETRTTGYCDTCAGTEQVIEMYVGGKSYVIEDATIREVLNRALEMTREENEK